MSTSPFRSTDPEKAAAIEAVIAEHRSAIKNLKAARPADAHERRQLKKAIAEREKAIQELRAQLPPTVLDEDAAIAHILDRVETEIGALAEVKRVFSERMESDPVWALEGLASKLVEATFSAQISRGILEYAEKAFAERGRTLDTLLDVLTDVHQNELVRDLVQDRWDGGSSNDFTNACEHATRRAASQYARYTIQYWIGDVRFFIGKRGEAAPA